MPTIEGPKVQTPSPAARIIGEGGSTSYEWQAFFDSMQQVAYNGSRSGPTGSRPTNDFKGRWIGMPYFDTTLGIPIWLSSVSPDVWVRYDGTAV